MDLVRNFSDLIFGIVSLLLGYQFYRMLNSRDEFKCGPIEFILISLPILSGIFFIIHFAFIDSFVQVTHFLRILRFPLMAVNVTFWLYLMTPKMINLPRKSDLIMINNALSSEIRARALVEEKLINLNSQLDKMISEKTSQLQAIIDNSPLAMVQVDADAKVVMWNKAAEKLFGWKECEVIGKQLPTVKPEQLEDLKQGLYRTIVQRLPFHGEVTRLHKDGSSIDVCIWNASIVVGQGQPLAMAMFSDNTERKKMVDDLQKAKLVAQVANQSKSDFLARVSHEIRTPLNAIIGFSDILSNEDVDEREKKLYLNTLSRNSQFLSLLINDILDFSKIEAGKIVFESKVINLLETIHEVIETANIQVISKPVKIILEPLPQSIPTFIRTDPLRLRQILLNIVGNSIKFTCEGYVKISVEFNKMQSDQNLGLLNIRVKDSGIGMTEQQAEMLFKPYYQAGENTSRKFGGTGLGLSISKHLAKLMGGDLTLENSTLGNGTEFLITIETREVVISTEDKQSIKDFKATNAIYLDTNKLQGKKILVVDDSADNLMLVSRIISKMGGTVETAEDGIVGVEKASHNKYDVVIMDLEMPKMSGIQALQKLRSLGVNTHIIALTGHAYEDDRTRCLDAGFDDHVSKPINRKVLLESVLKNLTYQSAGITLH